MMAPFLRASTHAGLTWPARLPVPTSAWIMPFMGFAALGVAGYLGHLAYSVFEDSLLFPIVLTLIGLGIMALGLLYQKRRAALSDKLQTLLPERARVLLPALRR